MHHRRHPHENDVNTEEEEEGNKIIDVEVPDDPRDHPNPSKQAEVILFMIHLEGGCKVCRRLGPRWPDEEEDDDK
jgi:hypothetical protein